MRFTKRWFLYIFLFSMLLLFLSSCGPDNKTVEITYNSNGGSDVSLETLIVDSPITLPTNPTKDGFTFAGWFFDDKKFEVPYTTDYDLSLVEGDAFTVFAKWKIYEYTMIFVTNCDVTIDPIKYNFTDSIIKPKELVREGYTLIGWFRDVELTILHTFTIPINEDVTFYAKWELYEYTMTFVTNCEKTIDPIKYYITDTIIKPKDPVREGHIFIGWFSDVGLTNLYVFNVSKNADVTLYGKWEIKETGNEHLATEVLPVFSSLYGNTNGNLNNKGLAVYDTKRALHYISHESSVYTYNPANNETTLLFKLTSEGRATFLNMDKDILYFIDSYNGYLISYHIEDNVFTTISETENIYASRTQSWVNFIYPTIKFDQEYVALQRYITSNKTLAYIQGYGFEHLNIYGTRTYYKPIDSLSLNVMNYNGQGKATVINLETFNVTNQFETLLYNVDQDYVSYFALILEIGHKTGVYLYNSNDGLIEIMLGDVRNLNYDGKHIYFISSSSLYKIDLVAKTPEKIYDLSSSDAYLNIVNNWFYIGSYISPNIYRINPVSKKIEYIFD